MLNIKELVEVPVYSFKAYFIVILNQSADPTCLEESDYKIAELSFTDVLGDIVFSEYVSTLKKIVAEGARVTVDNVFNITKEMYDTFQPSDDMVTYSVNENDEYLKNGIVVGKREDK